MARQWLYLDELQDYFRRLQATCEVAEAEADVKIAQAKLIEIRRGQAPDDKYRALSEKEQYHHFARLCWRLAANYDIPAMPIRSGPPPTSSESDEVEPAKPPLLAEADAPVIAIPVKVCKDCGATSETVPFYPSSGRLCKSCFNKRQNTYGKNAKARDVPAVAARPALAPPPQ